MSSASLDVAAPITCAMRAALVRPHGVQPDGVQLIRHVSDLPALPEPA